ncbi:MAG: cupredoxin domain-containing protein [Thaumarchaeota archaeon]|nr:cupredoxin domain-containing protein [Nitrososphaerota archaeon]
MSSKTGPLVGVVVAVLIIGALGSIGYYQFEVAPKLTTFTTTTTSSQAGCTRTSCVNVTIPSGASVPNAEGFAPGSVTVVIGVNNTIIWTNADQAPHTVTATDNSFNSHNMDPGATFEFTFTHAGTFQYGCSYHGWMHGTVIVKSA